jgi:hypothetical protein
MPLLTYNWSPPDPSIAAKIMLQGNQLRDEKQRSIAQLLQQQAAQQQQAREQSASLQFEKSQADRRDQIAQAQLGLEGRRVALEEQQNAPWTGMDSGNPSAGLLGSPDPSADTPLPAGGGALGKITDYGQADDSTPDPDTKAGRSAIGRLTPDSMAVSPDIEAKMNQAGIRIGDNVNLKLADGSTITRRFDDRTAKTLTGRFDLYSPGGPHPLRDKPVVGFAPASLPGQPSPSELLNGPAATATPEQTSPAQSLTAASAPPASTPSEMVSPQQMAAAAFKDALSRPAPSRKAALQNADIASREAFLKQQTANEQQAKETRVSPAQLSMGTKVGVVPQPGETRDDYAARVAQKTQEINDTKQAAKDAEQAKKDDVITQREQLALTKEKRAEHKDQEAVINNVRRDIRSNPAMAMFLRLAPNVQTVQQIAAKPPDQRTGADDALLLQAVATVEQPNRSSTKDDAVRVLNSSSWKGRMGVAWDRAKGLLESEDTPSASKVLPDSLVKAMANAVKISLANRKDEYLEHRRTLVNDLKDNGVENPDSVLDNMAKEDLFAPTPGGSGGAASAQQGSGTLQSPAAVDSKDAYDALPKGSYYKDSTGALHKKT